MLDNSPQKKSRPLPLQVAALLPAGMSALVNPVPNREIAVRVPNLFADLCRETSTASPDDRAALHAGLWLLADDLAAAHTICQDIPTSHGSAWHAIMHRREGDFSNSKYWWRRAGGMTWQSPSGSPLHQELAALLAKAPPELLPWRDVLASRNDPPLFVDRVERHHRDSSLQPFLVAVQRLEWASLFTECLSRASGA